MYHQVHDLQKKGQYTLQLQKLQNSDILKLLVNTSKKTTDVYSSSELYSLKDVENLENYFDDMEIFREYVKDPEHWQLNLEHKSVTIIEKSQTKKNKITEIAVINLKFVETVEREEYQQLISLIMERCNSKEFKQDDIKKIFENVAVCLSELML